MTSNRSENSLLKVRVQPRSSRNQVDGYEEDILRLRVTAPPANGQANVRVIALLSKTLGISKSRLEIVRGHSSRDKLVSIESLTQLEVHRRIESETEES